METLIEKVKEASILETRNEKANNCLGEEYGEKRDSSKKYFTLQRLSTYHCELKVE